MSTNSISKPPSRMYISEYRRPYLNLKERLSQVWLNYYTVFLLLILIKVLLFKKSLDNSLDHAKDETYSICDSAEVYASSLVSIPHYLAKGTNILSAKAMNEVNQALVKSLKLILTGSENLIFFAIEMTIGTYTCVLSAAVGGAAHIALNATESVIELANDTMVSVADDIDDGLQDLSKLINKVFTTVESTVDSIENLFGDDDDDESDIDSKFESVNLTISSLKDWKISSSVTDKIDELGDKIPDFDDVENYTKSLIDVPFSKLRTEISNSLNNTFSADEMLVPDKKQLSFCKSSNDIEEFYNKSAKVLHTTSVIIMVILIVTMIIFILIEAYGVIREWKRIQYASEDIKHVNQMNTDGDYKFQYNIEVIDSLQHRYSSMIGNWLGKMIGGDNHTKKNNTRWVFNYMTSPTALSLLLLGIAGILAFALQIIMLKVVSSIDSSDLRNMFSSVAKDVSNNISNDIDLWVNDTNDYIQLQQDTINDDLFGWVNTTAYAINDTVTDFIDEMNDKIEDIFGDTIFYDSIENIVGCVITRKLENVQKAMSWLSNNSEVTFPTIDRDSISKSISDGSEDGESTDDGVNNYLEDIKDNLGKVWKKIVQEYKESLYTELYIALSLIGAWVLLLIIAFVLLYINEKLMDKKLKKEEMFGAVDDPLTPIMSREEEKSVDQTTETEKTNTTMMDSTSSSKRSIFETPNQRYHGLYKDQNETPNSNHFKGNGMIDQTLAILMNNIRENVKRKESENLISVKDDSDNTLTPEQVTKGLFRDSLQPSPDLTKGRNWRDMDPELYEKMLAGDSDEIYTTKNNGYSPSSIYDSPQHPVVSGLTPPPPARTRSNSWNMMSPDEFQRIYGGELQRLQNHSRNAFDDDLDSSVDYSSFNDSTCETARKWEV